MIAAEKIGFRAGGRALVADIDLAVPAGTFLGLVGPNGAGKSTLMRLLAGEAKPSAGRAFLDGRELAQWRAPDLARRRAILPQQGAPAFEMAARAVVSLGRLPHEATATRAENEAAVARALEMADAAHLAARNFATLSGGEQQRVQLARVLAQIDGAKAPLLLLDEPTASLDLAHQHQVLRLARRVAAGGGAVIAVLHDLFSASMHCDRIAVLDKGRLAAHDAPQLALSPSVVAAVFGMRACWTTLDGGALGLVAY